MQEILTMVLKSTLTMTGVGLAAWLLSSVISRRYSSHGLYALWIVVIAGFLVPLPDIQARTPVTVRVPEIISRPLPIRTEAFTPYEAEASEKLYVSGGARSSVQPALPTVTLWQVLGALYGAGVSASLGLQLIRHRRFMRTVRRWAYPAGEEETLRIFEGEKRSMRIRRRIELLVCPAIDSPMLAGWIHPRILLPEDAPKGEALALVLRHELIHFTRGDLLIKLIELLACALHWFNPVVYIAARTASYYCELSCDARTMQQRTLDERALYSHTILHALREARTSSSMLTTYFSADRKTLTRRIQWIMERKNRKRGGIFAVCTLLLTLAVGTSFVIAEGTAKEAWNGEPMTRDEMLAIWQESFEKMNTEATAYNPQDTLMLPEDLPAWEAEYTAQTGLARKEDLIISTLPGAHDMPYEEALAYAKTLIMDKYGTPQEELDAMGVYPRFMDYVYMEEESEWEFYLSPYTDCDVDMDHECPAPGEYRVTFTTPSKEVTLCNWYIDDFWAYAQRVWDAGKRDIVYQAAQAASFYTQSAEQQAHFTQLLTQAGYDMNIERPTLLSIEIDLMHADPAQSVLTSGSEDVRAALGVLEREYGVTAAMLDRHDYVALYSPLETGTTDICFVYNWALSELRAAQRSVWENSLSSYARHLGNFMVSVDDAGEVTAWTHTLHNGAIQQTGNEKLLEKWNWTAEDMEAFEGLCEQVKTLASGTDNDTQREAAIHTLLREYGGDAGRFPAREPDEAEIDYDEAERIARNTVTERRQLSPEESEAMLCEVEFVYTQSQYNVYCFAPEASDGYRVEIDAKTREVTAVEETQSNG